MADPLSSAPAAAPAVAPVAPVGSPGAAVHVPPSPSAAVTAPLFGGFRGGRPRLDGLKPGSPEAIEADREKNRLRMERKRAAERAANPPALPSAAPGNGAAAPPAPGVPALGPAPALEAPVVPWDTQTLKPLFEQLIPALEQIGVNQIAGRASKAKLPRDLVNEIEKDAKWSAVTKKAIELSAPQVAAKWLNASGISAEHQAELVLGTAVASLVSSHVLLLRKLDKLIADQAASRPPDKPEEKKS